MRERVRPLFVAHHCLQALDATGNVPVGYKNVRPTVELIVEEKACESHGEQRLSAHLGTRRHIHKQSRSLVWVNGKHPVREITDQPPGLAGPAKAPSVSAHPSA